MRRTSFLKKHRMQVFKEKNWIDVSISLSWHLLCNNSQKTLINCSAGGLFIDQNFAKKFKVEHLEELIRAFSVDGTKNKKGTIKSYVDLEFRIEHKKFREQFYVTGLGKQKIILGFPWLSKHNLIIGWKKGEIKWQPLKIDWKGPLEKGRRIRKEWQPKVKEIVDEEETKNYTNNSIEGDKNTIFIELLEESTWINKMNMATELAIKENNKKEEKTDEELVPKEFHDYLDIFSKEKAHQFPEPRPWDHKIKMKEGFRPKSSKNYNLTLAEQIKLDKFLKENLEKGYIKPSQSLMASPFFFVNKKDGKLQPCQDYWYLNDWTIKNSYPLSLISEIMDKLKGTKYFTKLDIHWGYNNMQIRKGDESKAAFKTNKGLFELTVMFFGMCNSPAMFQSMMDNIFIIMIEGKLVIVYMDDILIFAGTKEELTQITKMVLKKLKENDLFLKAKECESYKTKNEYLGMIIKEGKISMDPVKLGGIRDWPTPTMVKQVWSFLGFGNFYRKFISHYSDLARPLNNLTKEDKKFEWTTKCQEVFDILKQWFTEEPVLLMPDQSKLFQIKSDALKVATGAVLTQLDLNGDRHPVAFMSKMFTDTERKYAIYDRELLGIIQVLKEWRHYLQGSGHTTVIFSDHKNLTYFRTAQKLNNRQVRWSLYFSEFDIKLIHLLGSKMIQSNALSWQPDYGIKGQLEEEETIMLPENMFINLLDTDLQERILNRKELDIDVKSAIETLLQEGPTSLKNNLEDWKIEEVDGRKTIFYKGKNYIPKDQESWWDVVKMYHDHETAGHLRELETCNSIQQHYWWLGLQTFVKNYVQGYGMCQQFKINRSPLNPAYQAIEGAEKMRL